MAQRLPELIGQCLVREGGPPKARGEAAPAQAAIRHATTEIATFAAGRQPAAVAAPARRSAG